MKGLKARLPRLNRKQRCLRNWAVLLLVWGTAWWSLGMPSLSGDFAVAQAERRELLEHGRSIQTGYNPFGIRVSEHYCHSYIDYSYYSDRYERRVDIRAIPRTGEPLLIPGSAYGNWVEAVDFPAETALGRLTLRLWGADFDETWEMEQVLGTDGRLRFYLPYPSKNEKAMEALSWFCMRWRPSRSDVFYEIKAAFYDSDRRELAVIREQGTEMAVEP